MAIRVYQLAKEFGISSKKLLRQMHDLKVEAKGHMSSLDEETAESVRRQIRDILKKEALKATKPAARPKPEVRPKAKVIPKPEVKPTKEVSPKVEEVAEEPKVELRQLELKLPVTVKELALKFQVKTNELIMRLMKKKVMATINQPLPEEVAREIAQEYGFRIDELPSLEEQILELHREENRANLVPRPPVVTLMGHVDHGKTSLLDVIRKSRLTEKEAGGITQHIGAYEVTLDKGRIAFLDTPGHEAFTAMRARGAQATDIVILVVAADDGVKPQTIEAIDHARAAGVPIVVAINKIDKPNVEIERVKKQLSDLNLKSEDWGGKTITVPVSAKTHEGVDALLEMLLLEAEMLELKANTQKAATGVVIEGRLSRGKGPVATVLVKNGTLRIGDAVVIGDNYGTIRAMMDDRGRRVKETGPSKPVEILGLSGVPLAGDQFYVVPDERKAKEISEQKQLKIKEKGSAPLKRITLEELYGQIREGKIKELNLILKSDVQGSVEALKDSLLKLSTKDIRLNDIHSGVGLINEADIMLAVASNAIVIGFHVHMTPSAQSSSEREGVDVRLYRIIYDVIADIKAAMEGMLEPRIEEIFMGRAQVRQVFKVSKVGLVAGCIVQKGTFERDCACRLLRDGQKIYEGKISSLKRFKEDAKEVREGFECGVVLTGWKDIKAGDVIEAYEIKKTARRL